MNTRRTFLKQAGGLGMLGALPSGFLGTPIVPEHSHQEPRDSEDNGEPEVRFPKGDYTPFGYLDNPFHSMILNPAGLFRSQQPIGFLWGTPNTFWDPDQAIVLRPAFRCGNKTLSSLADFEREDIPLSSRYHSKNLFSYDWQWLRLTFSLKYALHDVGPEPHSPSRPIDLAFPGPWGRHQALFYVLAITNTSGQQQDVDVYHVFEFNDGAGQPLTVQHDPVSHCIVAKHSPDAQFSLAFTATATDGKPLVANHSERLAQFLQGGGLTAPEARRSYFSKADQILSVWRTPLLIPGNATIQTKAAIMRARDEKRSKALALKTVASTSHVLAQKIRQDNDFWSGAPFPVGDWPSHWKHGWVYDYETLRMTVREPMGVFRGRWDGMQIVVPRIVLGETSIDAHGLSYADERIAKEMFLTIFEDAPAANLPCIREDGSNSMVLEDGSEAGTAVNWCYPFFVLRDIYLRTGDRAWIERLYPRLESFLEWTLTNRTDKDGWLVYKSAWESGMDGSKRFGIAMPTGGAELTDFLRPSEGQAAMAHAANTVALFARELGLPAGKVRGWETVGAQFGERTRKTFHKNWFRDCRSADGSIIDIEFRSQHQMTPVILDVTTPEQDEAIRAELPRWLQLKPMKYPESVYLELYNDEYFSGPSPYALLETATRLKVCPELAECLYTITDHIFSLSDRRKVGQPDELIPGISLEHWPAVNSPVLFKNNKEKLPPPFEGYGWSAYTPMNIIRHLIGFRVAFPRKGFVLNPNFPKALLEESKTYGVTNLKFRSVIFDVSYRVESPDQLQATLDFRTDRVPEFTVFDESGGPVPCNSKGSRFALEMGNAREYRFAVDA